MTNLKVEEATTCCAPDADPCCDASAQASESDAERVREEVRTYYAERATSGTSCCGPSCGCGAGEDLARISSAVGYTQEELAATPEGANLGLGCGNPTAIDEIPEGATVLDLGSGAGIDCFLAARKVGPTGRVVGVDMTPEMVERARRNAVELGAENVEFIRGHIEELPIETESIDIVISNCVINLSPDKPAVFREAFRVLRPGGRLMVSDLVLTRDLPNYLRQSAAAYAGCIAGAEQKYSYLAQIEAAGFENVYIAGEDDYLGAVGEDLPDDWVPEEHRAEARVLISKGPLVTSLKVSATRPR